MPETLVLQIDSMPDFESHVLAAQPPVLVDFYSDSCPPCRQLAPTLDALAEEYEGRALLFKVNVEDAPDVAQRYGIQGLPAVVFFSAGQEIERLVRLQPRKVYTDALDRLID